MSDKRYLPAKQVLARYGITDMTLWRWLRDKDLGFPQPKKIRGRRYFEGDELDEFDARQEAA